MKNQSFIEMPAQDVIKMAQRKLRAIKRARGRLIRRVVAEERLRLKKSLIRRLFGRKVPPTSEIIKGLEVEANYKWHTPLTSARMAYSFQEEAVEKLLTLAKNSVEKVFITAEDLDML